MVQRKRRHHGGDSPLAPSEPSFGGQVLMVRTMTAVEPVQRRRNIIITLKINGSLGSSGSSPLLERGLVCTMCEPDEPSSRPSPVVERDTDLRPPSASTSRKSPRACKRRAPLLPEWRRLGSRHHWVSPPSGVGEPSITTSTIDSTPPISASSNQGVRPTAASGPVGHPIFNHGG